MITSLPAPTQRGKVCRALSETAQMRSPLVTSDLAIGTIESICSEIVAAGGSLTVEHGNIRCRIPKSNHSSATLDFIRANKQAFVDFISSRAHADAHIDVDPVAPFTSMVGVPPHQEAVWQQMIDGKYGVGHINMACAFEFAAPVDVATLQRAVMLLCDRHPLLMSRITDHLGRFFFVAGNQPSGVEPMPFPSDEISFTEAMRSACWRPFGGNGQPLFRVFCSTRDSGRYVIGFVLHHFIGDRTTMVVLIRELLTGYSRLAAGLPIIEMAPAADYLHHLFRFNSWLTTDQAEQYALHWRSVLGRLPEVIRLPVRDHLELDTPAGFEIINFSVTADIATNLEKFARQQGTSLFVILLTAKAVCLSQFTGLNELAIIMLGAGRFEQGTSEAAGPYWRNVLLTMNVDPQQSFVHNLSNVHEAYVASYRYEAYPFELVQDAVVRQGVRFTYPLFNYISGYDYNFGDGAALNFVRIPDPPDVQCTPRRSPSHYSEIMRLPAGLVGHMSYLSSVHDRSVAQAFVDAFMHLLKSLAENVSD